MQNDDGINMFWLMGWEYGRIWFNEHVGWEVEMYEVRDFGKKVRESKLTKNKKKKK